MWKVYKPYMAKHDSTHLKFKHSGGRGRKISASLHSFRTARVSWWDSVSKNKNKTYKQPGWFGNSLIYSYMRWRVVSSRPAMVFCWETVSKISKQRIQMFVLQKIPIADYLPKRESTFSPVMICKSHPLRTLALRYVLGEREGTTQRVLKKHLGKCL